MHLISERRRRAPMATIHAIHPIPADLGAARLSSGPGSSDGEGWLSLVGQGSGFHDCPLCRELASGGEPIPTVVDVRRESLPLLARTGWLDDLLELVGPNATVRVMGRAMEAEPVEELSMEAFLARLGYE